ncbi:MAG: nucleotidyl transferase AbiEii/AbiGii toxin family protein [Longimicrobiales bacterium]|nr:nucleotidyl transferase AbiEii/AbiGii toxin family protein [Longimicrobiales bacterium]
MITGEDVSRVAGLAGFRPEVVEKVLRLHGILDRLDRHEMTSGAWVLKGGTALNLVHLDVPRLSVDIDINYVGSPDVEGMQRARPDFERALEACCEREGCAVRRTPSEHAGGKFRLRYGSVLGGSQNLEVDVSYVARVPIWGAVRSAMRFPPGSALRVPTLTLEELAAGKFAALVQRSAARDAFDAVRLLELAPDLLRRIPFRVAFVCFVAASRFDARNLRRSRPLVSRIAIERDLQPLLRLESGIATPTRAQLGEWIEETAAPAIDLLLTWSAGERAFLDRLLDDGEIDAAALHDDLHVRERILRQPMLAWKAQHVREHRRRP